MEKRTRKPSSNGADLCAGLLRLYVLHRAGVQPFRRVTLVQHLAGLRVPVNSRSVYPILRGLEAEGLLQSEPAPARDPEKGQRLYRLTADGRREISGARARLRAIAHDHQE